MSTILLELLVSIVSCGLSCCFAELWNELGKPELDCVKQYETNLQDLKDKFETLNGLMDRSGHDQTPVEEDGGENNIAEVIDRQTEASQMEQEVKKLKLKEEIEKNKVPNWQTEASQMEQGVEELKEKIEKMKKKNLNKWHPEYWCSRYQISREAKTKTVAINVLVNKFDNSATVGDFATTGFILLESSEKAINQIMGMLKDKTNNSNIIGVHGMGGVGKSWMIEQVAERAEKEKLFDKVVIVKVTETPNVNKIQNTIAGFFRFKFEEGSESLRGSQLSRKLKQKSKVLIILDDLWEKLELGEVGIPYGDEHKGCKIIVTSRELRVCNQMQTNKNVHMEEISEEEALYLLKKIAGIPESHDRAAKEVIKQCGKLPIAIALVAGAFRDTPIEKWNDSIQELKKNPLIKIGGISEEVVLCVKLGYDYLKSEAARLCLLFCCLFPAYYSVSMEELVMYGLVDRLFPEVDTLEDARTRMHSVVNDLKSSNFLLEGDREGCFRVHDDTRKVVMFLAPERRYNPVAEAGQRLTSWPQEETSGSCKRMSLMDNRITKLPDEPQCPQLLTLFLQNNPLEDIPDRFFGNMRALTYLDMSNTCISSLPWSFFCLEDLRLLRLENTRLTEAPLKEYFDKLEVLNLRGSCMKQLPEGLKEMADLKILVLSNNLHLEGIPSTVISTLTKLEELYIGNSFGEWGVEGTRNQHTADFSEVASLAHLTVLHIHVKNTKSLSVNFDGPWGNLRKFRICVNDDYWDISSARSMHLKNLSHPVANWVKLLLEKTHHLALARSRDLEDIVKKDVDDLKELKSLHLRACNVDFIFPSSLFPKVINLEELNVEYCYSLREVFRSEEIENKEEQEERVKLARLRELILVGLPKLTTIWKGNLSAAHLENLKLMKVKECRKLKVLFSEALAQKVHQLEHLAIMNCDNMEEIILNEQARVNPEADNILSPMFFKSLQKLIISKCKKMKSALTLRLVRGLEQLEEIAITGCNQMEEVISMGEEEEKAEDKILLPSLKILALQNLPKLGTIYKGELLLTWRCLLELQVWNCPNIKKLPFGLRGAPKLRKFKGQVEWFDNLEWKDKNMIKRLRPLLTEESQVLQNLNEAAYPKTICLIPPNESNARTLDRLKHKSDKSIKLDPSAFKYVQPAHASYSSVRQGTIVSPTGQLEDKVPHPKAVAPIEFSEHFPIGLRDFIRHTKNVAADGNCGFTCVADLVGLGENAHSQVRQELYDELMDNCKIYTRVYGSQERVTELGKIIKCPDPNPSRKNWMTMPDMGHLIASRYQVVLFQLSMQQCLTFLPLRSAAPVERKEIAIGFVQENHFVQVFLNPGHPVPPIATKWLQHHDALADGWQFEYTDKINNFRKIVSSDVVTKETVDSD